MGKLVFMVVLLNLLLLFVFAITSEDVEKRKLATENPGYINIDCGADADYVSDYTGKRYRTDKDFINTGENHNISSEYEVDDYQLVRQLSNLRSFPQGRKNCYTLELVEQNSHYLIRGFFYYGNYDGKNLPPTFDIYMGVNYWTTLKLKEAVWTFPDIVFVVSTDSYVCLVNTDSGVPLISSLELRPLNNSIYQISSGTISNRFSYDVASSTESISRYRDDVYDRSWFSYQFPDSVRIKASSDIDPQAIDNLYKLPAEVLRTAAQAPNISTSLSYTFRSNSSKWFYVYFHFAEIVKTDLRRKFTITLNDVNYGPYSLEYLKPLSICPQKSPVQTNFSFTIDATMDSDLPPILNAFEIYKFIPLPFSPTHPSDVDAIMSIKHTYNISIDDWQGDPCLPNDYSWSGLSCRFNSTPRIISLNLSSNKLKGEISPKLADLQAIESIDLSNNELSGQVPEVLAQLLNLKVLNLSGNKLTGSIPQSLKEKSDTGSLVLSLTGNPDLCQIDPCHREEKKNFPVSVVALIVASVLILIFLSILIVFCIIRRRRQREPLIKSTENGSFKSKNRPFTYSQIVRITDNFNTIVGEGGFGKVYLGTLNNNTQVAVKLLSPSSNQGYKEFRAEAQLLMIVHHRNLVSLIGYCDESHNMALIYEYMANGNLRQHLSETNKNVSKWKERLQIAIDAAHGLEYLHNGCTPPIVHRDLKSANILLTENLQAKIADFGLSKMFKTENASHISTCPAGTPGYLDPEFQASGNLNKKSDVYSFGIILFELITGQPAIIRRLESSIHILQWLRPIVDKGDIRSIIDTRLQGEFDVNAAWKVVEIAMSCAQPASMERPDMGLVLTELKECMAIEMALGRTQRKQRDMTESDNLLEMTLLNEDSDMVPIAR